MRPVDCPFPETGMPRLQASLVALVTFWTTLIFATTTQATHQPVVICQRENTLKIIVWNLHLPILMTHHITSRYMHMFASNKNLKRKAPSLMSRLSWVFILNLLLRVVHFVFTHTSHTPYTVLYDRNNMIENEGTEKMHISSWMQERAYIIHTLCCTHM